MATNRWLQIALVLILGIGIGAVGPREYKRRFGYRWLSSYEIFQFADQRLLKDAHAAEAEVQEIVERITALQLEREKLGIPFGTAPAADEPSAITKLREATREARTKDIALHEQRERARRIALQDIYEKLKDGRLVAKGFKFPLGLKPKEAEIPASHWRFLKFSTDYQDAEGKGLKYTAIAVSRSGWH